MAQMGSEKETQFEVKSIIHGFNITVIEYVQHFKAKGKDKIEEIKRRKVTFLEFEGPKIKKILDYE